MKQLLALIATGFLVAACEQPAYTATHEYGFVQGCRSTGRSVAFCTCAWTIVREEVPREAYDRYESLPEAERLVSATHAQLQEIGGRCAAQLGEGANAAPETVPAITEPPAP